MKNKTQKKNTYLVFTKLYLVVLLAFWFPSFSFAAVRDLKELLDLFIDFNIRLLIPLAFSCGVLFFMWRGAVYVFNSGSEEGKSEGKRVLMWGVISLFLTASIWGIIRFAQQDSIGDVPPLELPILQRNNSR